MRKHRILISVLAFCLIGLVPFAGSTSANAAEPAAEAQEAVEAPILAKPTRRVSFKFKQTGGTFKLYGKVQAAKKKKIILTRSNTKKGKYRNFKTTRTSAKGRYAFTGMRKAGWYKVKVPSTRKWATTTTGWIHVFYA